MRWHHVEQQLYYFWFFCRLLNSVLNLAIFENFVVFGILVIPKLLLRLFSKLSEICSRSVFFKPLLSQALYISSGLIFFVRNDSLKCSALLSRSRWISSIVSTNIVVLYPLCWAISINFLHESVDSGVFRSIKLIMKLVSKRSSTFCWIGLVEYTIQLKTYTLGQS